MSLSIAQLRERVASRFSDFEQVDDSVIRFTKKAGERAFAVCYLDVAQDLPDTEESLTKYQDRVIGKHYFEGGKSIQWNNYLYFITSADRLTSNEARHAKELIERDRSYARKFVIPEEDLDSVLTQPIIEIASSGPRINVTSRWMDRLAEAGLDQAIVNNENLPKRLALIESSAPTAGKRPKRLKPKQVVSPPPFIRSLDLMTFRRFPLQRQFNFGVVNLIFGSNATGKTSLLEAIELFYCGRNKRNPDDAPLYELDAVLADGSSEKANDDRSLQEFRDRNLNWYGVSEVKTAKLYSSFSQFNFLDTDAAVSLTDSTAHIDEDLARLLVGSDASRIWENINRVCEAVSIKLNDLRAPEKQIAEEIAVLRKRITETAGIKQESDAIRIRLEQMIDRAGWRSTPENKETFATILVETLTEMVSVAQQASALSWTSSPVSMEGLVKYSRDAKVESERAAADIERLGQMQLSRQKLADTIKRDRAALDLARQAKRTVEAGVAERVAERTRLQNIVAGQSGALAGFDGDGLKALSASVPDMSIAVCLQRATSTRAAAEALLIKRKSEYADFTKLRDRSLSLMQELRETAGRILQNASTPDRCPLCHTQFEPGGLAKHMNLGVDEHLEAAGQKLLNQVRQQETAVNEAVVRATAGAWLKGFCERSGLSDGISVVSGLSEIEKARQVVADSQARVKLLEGELHSLEAQGFSVAKLDEALSQLRRSGFRNVEASREALDLLLSTLEKESTTLASSLETESKQADELLHALQARFALSDGGLDSVKSALSQVNETPRNDGQDSSQTECVFRVLSVAR